MTAGDRLNMDIDTLPLVRISLDLTEGDKFEDPRGFLKEVAAMTELIQQARTNIIREYKARNPPMATPQMQSNIRLEQSFEDSMDTAKITPPESTHVENSIQDALVEDSPSLIAEDRISGGLMMGNVAAMCPGDAADTATESAGHMHEPATAVARGLMSIRRLVRTGKGIVKLPHISAKAVCAVFFVCAKAVMFHAE
ncbi:predicted protein [Postia placenta Mad-698-R]|nr:predicted protein [Postia placenta Mad-698-R]